MKPDECCFYCVVAYEEPKYDPNAAPDALVNAMRQYAIPTFTAPAVTMFQGTPVCMNHAKDLYNGWTSRELLELNHEHNLEQVKSGYRGQVRAQYKVG